ncbi:MAG: DNA repair protein RecN [Microthrixaceae bacterium]
MLVELVVRNLGVIESARIPLGAGMTALTGETGAGKTMLVEALRLLMGERADASKVRPAADEASIEGLFAGPADRSDDVGHDQDRTEGVPVECVPGDGAPAEGVPVEREWVLRRVVPAEGRSRSYLDGGLATAASVAGLASSLLEVHGQHGAQVLLSSAAQRDALDRYGDIDTAALTEARGALKMLTDELDDLGGDERERERQIDLLRYQLEEIAAVSPVEGEEEILDAEEDLLAGAVEYRARASRALELLTGGSIGEAAADTDGTVLELLARARAELAAASPFEDLARRLDELDGELTDCVSDLRSITESIEPDHERLSEVRERRHALVELRRKYGATIAEVIDFERVHAEELAALEGTAQRRAALAVEIDAARSEVAARAAELGAQRRRVAPELAAAIEGHLGDLAMAGARVEIAVEDSVQLPGAGEAVEFRLAANRGAPMGPLAKVASGGELSRVMLALRLVLSGGPPTMVFDEVDAGIGGQAAVAVGRALAALAKDHQVLVVTHLPQVAAFADAQVSVQKDSTDLPDGGSAVTTAVLLSDEQRVVELSRMLSGQPDSDAARRHASELLAEARR